MDTVLNNTQRIRKDTREYKKNPDVSKGIQEHPIESITVRVNYGESENNCRKFGKEPEKICENTRKYNTIDQIPR